MYPPLWFWIGGKLAVAANMPAWEFYKYFAIVTMSVVGPITVVLWRRIIGFRAGLFAGFLTSVAGLHSNAYEPYSWIVIALIPPVSAGIFWASRELSASAKSRNKAGLPITSLLIFIGAGIYLGIAALIYTLAAGIAAATIAILTIAAVALFARSLLGILRAGSALLLCACISMGIASVFWQNYLTQVVSSHAPRSVAPDFIPESSSFLPTPFFDHGALGIVSIIGGMWIVFRSYHFISTRLSNNSLRNIPTDAPSPLHSYIPLSLLCCLSVSYTWYVVSMFQSLQHTSLLPFRTIPLIITTLVLGAVCACADIWRLTTIPQSVSRAVALTLASVVMFASVALAQHPQ